jgi:hypothetical protein
MMARACALVRPITSSAVSNSSQIALSGGMPARSCPSRGHWRMRTIAWFGSHTLGAEKFRGLAQSHARPGAHVTGVSDLHLELM